MKIKEERILINSTMDRMSLVDDVLRLADEGKQELEEVCAI